MLSRKLRFVLFPLSLALCAQAQQTQPAAPATGPSPATLPAVGALSATVTAVEGLVQVRESDQQPWKPATLGMVVGQGAEFRTGLRSLVRFEMPPDQVVTLDRLGTVKILDAIRTPATVKTDLGMKYGRVRYDIEGAGLQHDATIRSPGASLAVTGTRVALFNQGFYPVQAVSFTGRARFKDHQGRTTTLGGPGSSPITSTAGAGGPAQTALGQTYVDPTSSLAHSPAEQHAIVVTPLVTGFSFGPSISGAGSSIAPSHVNPTPSTPAIPPLGSGGLVFQLVWVPTSGATATPDLDLVVRSPLGELLSPRQGPSISRSGGHAPVDDRGNSTFRAGQEFAFWPTTYPTGTYRLQVQHVSGASAEFELFTIRNGRVTQVPTAQTLSSNSKPVNVTVNIPAGRGAPASASNIRARRGR